MRNPIVNRVFDYAIDKERTEAYLEWIKANVSGKTVVELGAGSGIMTWLCVKYGATHVYAYENNKRIIYWLKELFKDALFVFISVNLGFFILSQVTSFSLSGGDGSLSGKSVDAFVGDPQF